MYSGAHGVVHTVDPNSPFAGYLTIAWSFDGSEIIPSNQWLYTQFIFSETGYQFSFRKTVYGNLDFYTAAKHTARRAGTLLPTLTSFPSSATIASQGHIPNVPVRTCRFSVQTRHQLPGIIYQ
jgi:hypothetical protein